MKRCKWRVCVGLLMACVLAPSAALAVMVGQIDTFEDGTTQNWVVALLGASHPAPPVNVPSGGPGGVDDNYLRLTAVGGVGPGGRLAVLNLTQWAGDYLAAGIGAIRMEVNNFGATDLSLRLLFEDASLGPSTNEAFSAEAVVVPAGSGWVSVTFPILAAKLEPEEGTVVGALANTKVLRIFHNPDAGFPGATVVASLGVDNIEALAAPAPVPTLSPRPTAALAFLLCGAGLWVLHRVKRGRSPFVG